MSFILGAIKFGGKKSIGLTYCLVHVEVYFKCPLYGNME